MSRTLKRSAIALCAFLALAGCSKVSQMKGASGGVLAPSAGAPDADAKERRSTLATTRHVDMAVAPDAIAPLFNSTQAACEADAASSCVVMKSNLATGTHAHADLTLRATPAGIAHVLAKLRVNGGLVAETTESEDLAAPIVDTERQMAMARDYRDSLLALRAKGSNDIKTMMSVNEELARVQSQLESATGERAHLQQRIATETLTIAIATAEENERQAMEPMSLALREFGAHLAEAAATAITFVAFLIPWLFVLLPLGWFVRWLWRRRKSA